VRSTLLNIFLKVSLHTSCVFAIACIGLVCFYRRDRYDTWSPHSEESDHTKSCSAARLYEHWC